MRQAVRLPRWLQRRSEITGLNPEHRPGSRVGVVAIAAAALTGLGYIGVFVGQPALVLGLGGWVAFIVWTALTSLSLIHETAPRAATSATRPAPAY